MTKHKFPIAELFIATGCSHCPVVLTELAEQLKKGELAQLNITNIAVDNEKAAELNIRSVPWFSLASDKDLMIFNGQLGPEEIRNWIKQAQSDQGMEEYIEQTLAQGQLITVAQTIQLKPEVFNTVISMLRDEDTSIQTRIGLDALIEQFSGDDILRNHVQDFLDIASTDNLRLQIDALHYLALTGDKTQRAFIEKMLQHDNAQLREAAEDALETLDDQSN